MSLLDDPAPKSAAPQPDAPARPEAPAAVASAAPTPAPLRHPLRFRWDKLTLAGLGLLLIIAAGAAAPLLAPYDPDAVALLARNRPPAWLAGGSAEHLFGTDNLGRDLLSRCLFGIRTSFAIASIGLIFSACLGIAIGVAAGLGGAVVDRVLMTLVDVFLTLPNLLLMLCGVALLGTETWVLVLMIGLVKWEGYARLVRGQVLALREQGYVEAARTLGASGWQVAWRHILPNLASPLVVILTLAFPGVLLMEAGLSFLGVGVQPPTSSLGRMIGDGRDYLIHSWWISGMPSLVIVVITLLFQLIGDGLRDRLDVQIDD
ncbi:ABC transporter permease [Pseudooceanicola sp. 200-1SW]|uniref:ABC transporter permease n=1 Tax=Pseudooceanicola sp. 200-1SW TaxID=3425949 RepID=UPI003D7F6C71